MKARIYRIAFRTAYVSGIVTRWYASGWRRGNAVERLLILPPWAVFRSIFVVSHSIARATA